MRRLAYFPLAVGLAGCPPAPRYANVEVRDPGPVGDAVVAIDCGPTDAAVLRTDDQGRVRLVVHGKAPADRCTLTAVKPDHPTVEVDAVQLCSAPRACPATIIYLARPYGYPYQEVPLVEDGAR
jgi:hypothetical protein